MPNVKLGNDTLNGVNTVRLQKADGGGYESFVVGVDQVTWHQCADEVKAFILQVQTNNAYTPQNRTTVTAIDNYVTTERELTPDEIATYTKPHGKTIDGNTYYDNEPNTPTPFATESRAGTLNFLDDLRWYNTTKANGTYYPLGCNCRDLGGWNCDGGTVKYGVLVRSGELNPSDKNLMVDKIGIKTEICLLPVNKQQFQSQSPWGIDRVANWTNDDFMYRINNTPSIPTVVDQWKLYLTTIIRSINNGKPVIFHCGVGADKTGTMALMLLGILGVSEQDIDIDFELTAFYAGLHDFYRTRKLAEYNRLKNEIFAFPLVAGLADSLQNRCISFVLSLGITPDEINAFRSACIDGTPQMISPVLDSYTVTKDGGGVSYSNPASAVDEFQGYTTEITPTSGNIITNVIVTMGGVDITSDCFSGERVPFGDVTVSGNGEYDVSWKSSVKVNVAGGDIVTVTKSLGDSTCDNSQTSVIKGQSFGAIITPNTNKAISSITVTMGGTDITSSAVTLIN